MRFLCKVLGHRWSGRALVSTLDGHTTRKCSRCNKRVLIFMGYRMRYDNYA